MVHAKARDTRSRTRGRGKKKGRGKGLRGGRGNAGLLKHKIISTIKYHPDHFGRHGFKRPQTKVKANRALNLNDVSERLDLWLEQGHATTNKKVVELDLEALGYDKLLGTGNVDRALKITVAEASAKARERVEAAGGELNLDA